jgi:hypothetical protein
MIKKKIKIIEPKEVTIEERFCDFCIHAGRYTCNNCEKDLCYAHRLDDDYNSGDYPDHYCPECYPKYIEYKMIEHKEQNKLDIILEEKRKEIMNPRRNIQ